MTLLSRSEVYNVVDKYEGQIFNCVFIKKDGTTRIMKCRTGVTKDLKGGELPYDARERGLLSIYEIISDTDNKGRHLSISVNTMTHLNIGGQKYEIVDSIPNRLFDNNCSL
jgi:hypothetical protein